MGYLIGLGLADHIVYTRLADAFHHLASILVFVSQAIPLREILPIMNATLANPLLPPLPQAQGSTTVVVQLSAEDRYIEPKIDVLSWVMTILAGTVVGLRIYNKFRRRLPLWWDDYIVIVAWVWTVHRCRQLHE